MNEEKNKILDDFCSYLKFYIDNFRYPVYLNEIIASENPLFNDKRNEVREESNNLSSSRTLETEIKTGIIQVKDAGKNEIPIFKEEWMDTESLKDFEVKVKDCFKCGILSKTRNTVVFGYGNSNADIVIVGEAPGADEDIQGKPFVGRAGKLLTDILKAIKIEREEVYICNILKCRPPENRNPLPDEISNCEPYLHKQLEIIKPKLILALGTFAAQTLLRIKEPLGKLRGKFHAYNGIKMMVTYHPAALLRNPNWKKPTWEDIQLFRKEFDSMTVKQAI